MGQRHQEYIENQAALAESTGGRIAATMTPGSHWLTPDGDEVVVWMAWRPDLEGTSEKTAAHYKWPFSATSHNTEIGVTYPRAPRTRRIKVADVAGWKAAV